MHKTLRIISMCASALIATGCAHHQTEWMEQQQQEERNYDMYTAQSTVQNNAQNIPQQNVPYTVAVARNQQVMMSNLTMNNQGNRVMVKPSSMIQASAQYLYNCKTCTSKLNNQIVVGLGGRSAQACIYNGGTQGQGTAEFSLRVPAKPGKYEVRFLPIQAMDCSEALKKGWNAESSPSKQSTIGTIIVSRKAEA